MSGPATVAITMAGLGQRFRDAGYTVPKYQVPVHGRTLFRWSMESLRGFARAGSPFVFIVRGEDRAAGFIRAECEAAGIPVAGIVELDHLTDGQATSAALAAPHVARPDLPFLVYNIDTHVDPAHLPADAVRGDGWVPCFPGEGAGWSFAAADGEGRVHELREKVRISDDATLGLYWFSSLELYLDAYAEYYRDPANLEKGERYIAPLYNHLIRAGRPVYLHRVPAGAVIPLGTPAEVDRFRASRR